MSCCFLPPKFHFDFSSNSTVFGIVHHPPSIISHRHVEIVSGHFCLRSSTDRRGKHRKKFKVPAAIMFECSVQNVQTHKYSYNENMQSWSTAEGKTHIKTLLIHISHKLLKKCRTFCLHSKRFIIHHLWVVVKEKQMWSFGVLWCDWAYSVMYTNCFALVEIKDFW